MRSVHTERNDAPGFQDSRPNEGTCKTSRHRLALIGGHPKPQDTFLLNSATGLLLRMERVQKKRKKKKKKIHAGMHFAYAVVGRVRSKPDLLC